MSDLTESPETPKKGQLNEKQTKLLAAMTQNTVGKVEYNVSPTEPPKTVLIFHILTLLAHIHSGTRLPSIPATKMSPAQRVPTLASAPS